MGDWGTGSRCDWGGGLVARAEEGGADLVAEVYGVFAADRERPFAGDRLWRAGVAEAGVVQAVYAAPDRPVRELSAVWPPVRELSAVWLPVRELPAVRPPARTLAFSIHTAII